MGGTVWSVTMHKPLICSCYCYLGVSFLAFKHNHLLIYEVHVLIHVGELSFIATDNLKNLTRNNKALSSG